MSCEDFAQCKVTSYRTPDMLGAGQLDNSYVIQDMFCNTFHIK